MKLNGINLSPSNVSLSMNELDFISELKEIWSHLMQSKVHGNVIGISSEILGEGVFVTAVEDIIFKEGETIAVLKTLDMTGSFLRTGMIRVSDIKFVCPFLSPYKNPLIKQFEVGYE